MCNVDWSAVSAIASAIAAVAAAIAAFRVPFSAEKLAASLQTAAADRERKLDLLRRVAGYRAMPPTAEWTTALNEIAVTFNNRPAVMKALFAFEKYIREHGGHNNKDLVALIDAMLEDLGLSRAGLNEEFLLRPFRPNVYGATHN